MVYESNYRFHDPVRYFTANDPYYWEIDNIPLKQLMENDLWLKDQLESGLKITIEEIDRSGFSELKPYSEQVDNIVKVKPGRFTARINDPMADARQHDISRIAGEVFNEPGTWRVATYAASGIASEAAKLTSDVVEDSTFMNGLYERAFAYETVDSYNPPLPLDDTAADPRSLGQPLATKIFIPGLDVMFLIKDRSSIDQTFRFDASANEGQYIKYFDRAPREFRKYIHSSKGLEHTFIKFWRGVTRTAVVDVPNELSIEIPSFNIRDFDYTASDGTTVQRLNAEVRIDLLFIYSKPVDASKVKVRSNQGRSLSRTITRAELGLVRGAGVILDKTAAGYGFKEGAAAEDLGTKIFASVADALNTSAGFEREQVYGSFPAPDDLMTMTPLLMSELEDGHPSLVGQSILPIAYIVVRKPSGAASTPLILNSDIVDIRPFFRTTELSYNERAGIAAATPPISLANPVVSRLELKENNRKIKAYIDNLPAPSGTNNGPPPPGSNSGQAISRVIGAGYILGGLRYGPESAICDFENRYNGANLTTNTSKVEKLRDFYGYPQYLIDDNLLSPDPGWDVAFWRSGQQPEQANDYIDFRQTLAYGEQRGQNQPNYFEVGSDGISLATRGTFLGPASDRNFWNTPIFYSMSCRKTIDIDITNVQTVYDDFYVDVDYVNCTPMDFGPTIGDGGAKIVRPGAVVTKELSEQGVLRFVIECFWAPAQAHWDNDPAMTLWDDFCESWGDLTKSQGRRIRNDAFLTAGTAVVPGKFSRTSRNNPNLPKNTPGNGPIGLCSLPSIMFKIYGISSGSEAVLKSYDTINNPLRLS